MLNPKLLKKILVIIFSVFFFAFIVKQDILAQMPVITPSSCNGISGCPVGTTDDETTNITTAVNGNCVQSYSEWLGDPLYNHFWATDLEVTNQGKANDRARQFIYWTLDPTKNSIDDHQTLKNIWAVTRNIAMIMLIVVAAIMGIGIIISQRTNFDIKIPLWPSIIKLLTLLIYVNLSIILVIGLIQFSNYLTNTFTNALGGKDLFRIYFGFKPDDIQTNGTSESNYTQFVGCRDLNLGVQESANAAIFMMKATNVTYYVMGIILLLRKIILWFFIFVSPFLGILLPFILVRNTGYIWIGTFFQWLFYGPLFSLFLGGLATIWKNGIPFIFDFSRVDRPEGYVFPTGINILYGGPGQALKFLNNSNYIDTFMEYAITLIMLWAVIILPWLLLRIFRDYCCDGIYAMKNILISMYDQIRSKPQSPPPSSPKISPSLSSNLNLGRNIEVPVKVKLEHLEDIKQTNTQDISQALNLKISSLKDIVQIESTKETQTAIHRNLEYLADPNKAESPAERQKYMNIRTELFSRSVKEDQIAKNILSTIATSKTDVTRRTDEIIKNIPQTIPVTHVVSVKVKVSQDKISSLNNTLVNTVSADNNMLTGISQKAGIPAPQVQTILSSFVSNIASTPNKIVEKITQETKVEKSKVTEVIKSIAENLKVNDAVIQQIAQKENLTPEETKQIIETQLPLVAEPEKNIEQLVPIPSNVSIEDYEDVKNMWQEQYEKGEVPVSEHIKSREEWLDKDVVFISNTLNKLLSTDENLKREGLDNLNYVLPLFIINNLKGDELTVYLKAKLEAAKAIQKQITKEEEIKEKLSKENTEEFVDVQNKKSEEKAKEQSMEIERPEEEKNKI